MDDGLHLTHQQIEAAIRRGEAVPLAATVTWLIRYQDAWWVVYEGGWVKVTDALTTSDIDHASRRLASS